MRLNGIDFPLYVLDTTQTIEARIASFLKSTPDWLIFDKKRTREEYENANVTVENVLNLIYGSTSLTFSLSILPETKTIKDAETVFVATNRTLANSDENRRRILFLAMKFSIDPEEVYRKREYIISELEKNIFENASRVAQHEQEVAEFDNIPSIPFTDFELDHVQFTINYGETRITSLDELFNIIRLTKFVPYAVYGTTTGSIFKIYREFETNPEWLELELPNVVLLKVDCEQEDRKALVSPYKRFTSVAFTFIGTRLVATMDMNIGPRYINKQEFIDRVQDVIGITQFVDVKDNMSIAYFTFPRQSVDIAIYAELTMNDPCFNSIVAIDELARASKTKQNIYLHFAGTNETVSMIMKYTLKHHQFGIPEIGEPYIRCRAKTGSIEKLERLQLLLGKLFTLYNIKRQSVIDQYSLYIPNFEVMLNVKQKQTIKPEGLRLVAPEIFVPKYSRKCAHRPIIISDEESAKTSKQVMKFPTKGESIPRFYTCPTQQHPFIGLRVNDLENKILFPFIPCCFAKDQMNKQGTIFRKYFHEEEQIERASHVQEIYSTRKILPPDVVGFLPTKIQKLFGILDTNPNEQFVRKGVNRTKLSSIEACLLAKGKISYKSKNVGQRLVQSDENGKIMTLVKRERDRLATEMYAMATKQEMYDYSLERIINDIKTNDLRATKFVRLLEVAYDCNIFVFTAQDDGCLIVPRHTKAYYKFQPNRETIFLFQHQGTDTETYPQVELIFQTHKDDPSRQTYTFLPKDPIVLGIFTMFRRLSRSYIYGLPLPKLQMRRIPVVSQAVDMYGKCRLINVKHESNVLTIITDPIPPFAAVATRTIFRTPSSVVESFSNLWGFKIKWQRIDSNEKVKEIGINFGVHGVVLVDSSNLLVGVTVKTDDEEYKILSSNVIDEFSFNRRVAKILFQYTIYMVSKFLFENKIQNPTNSHLLQFTKHFEIIPTHKYKIPQTADFQDGMKHFVKNGNLIVQSQDVIRRLMFMLTLMLKTNPSEILEFKNNSKIPNYFDEIADFEASSNQYILNGKSAVLNLIKTYGVNYSLKKTIQPQSQYAYFFENEALNSNIYLAQNTTGLLSALTILDAWNRLKFNIGSNFEDVNEQPEMVQIYVYKSDNEIQLIENGKSEFGVILAYRIDGNVYYTALLKL